MKFLSFCAKYCVFIFGRFCDLVNSITEEAWKGPEEGECDTDVLEVRKLRLSLGFTKKNETSSGVFAFIGAGVGGVGTFKHIYIYWKYNIKCTKTAGS